MRCTNTKFRAGFSLVELLVVIAIIGVLSAILMTSLNSSKSIKDIEAAASLTDTLLRETQTAALSGQQYVADTTPCLYRLNYGGSVITTYYFWKDGSGSCANSMILQTAAFPSSVIISNSGTIDFVPPHARLTQDFTLSFYNSGHIFEWPNRDPQ
jgi:prepilin-type N-terminal cleavage/methylation domain-containing protein